MSINAGDALNEAFFRIQNLEAELAQVKAERKEWETKFKDLDRALACELRDPCGTIWEHAKKLQDKNDALRAELTNIANAKPHEWGEESDQFQAWAQNRARHALNPPDSGPAVHAEKLS